MTRMKLPYETQRDIELFLLREAKLLDAGAFEAWLALYAPARHLLDAE